MTSPSKCPSCKKEKHRPSCPVLPLVQEGYIQGFREALDIYENILNEAKRNVRKVRHALSEKDLQKLRVL